MPCNWVLAYRPYTKPTGICRLGRCAPSCMASHFCQPLSRRAGAWHLLSAVDELVSVLMLIKTARVYVGKTVTLTKETRRVWCAHKWDYGHDMCTATCSSTYNGLIGEMNHFSACRQGACLPSSAKGRGWGCERSRVLFTVFCGGSHRSQQVQGKGGGVPHGMYHRVPNILSRDLPGRWYV